MSIISVVNYIKKMSIFQYSLFVLLIISLQIFVADLIDSLGGVKSSLSYLMLLTIITGSFVLGSTGGLILGLTGGLFLGPFMPMNSDLSLMQNPPNWIFRMIFYVLIGSYSGAIMKYLLNTINKLSKITFYHTKTNLPNIKYFENTALTNYPSDAYFANLKFENYEKTKETFGENYANDFINFFSKSLNDVFGKKDLATVFYLGGGRFGIIFSDSEINSKFKSFFKTVYKKIRKKRSNIFPTCLLV